MKIKNNSSSIIIVLHEIYGINDHIELVCKKFLVAGYTVLCPNLLHIESPFPYHLQEKAYHHFMNHIGFDAAVKQVKKLLLQAKTEYTHVILLGYSIGATIAWLCSDESGCDGVIGYYGSRIRDYIDIVPKCPVLLIFSEDEKSIDIKNLTAPSRGRDIEVHILTGKHGFNDPFSINYSESSSKKAESLVDKFLRKSTLLNLPVGKK